MSYQQDDEIRILKFSINRTSKLGAGDFLALTMFSKAIYYKTPEALIPKELIESAKIAMQKSCRRKDAITGFYDMVYIAQEFINHWDLYKSRRGFSNLNLI